MSKGKCSDCCFGHLCVVIGGCPFFAPVDGEESDEQIEKRISADYKKFIAAWREYVSEPDD